MEENTDTINFGKHVTIDGYQGDPEKLNDKELVYKCLSELPEKLHMKKLAEPVIYHAEGNDEKDPGGWTGVVVINESHISIHTFPKRKFVTADVYTCTNDLDFDFVINYFKQAFDLQEIEENIILRGTRYPSGNIS